VRPHPDDIVGRFNLIDQKAFFNREPREPREPHKTGTIKQAPKKPNSFVYLAYFAVKKCKFISVPALVYCYIQSG